MAKTLDRLAGLVSSWEYKDPGDTLERQFRDAGFDLRHPRMRKFFELCLAVQDLPRHLGQHSGGMVICQGQLDSIVPLEPATMPGRVVVQWDKEDCADMGIVKVDLLGLGMMAVLEDSITLIRDHYREEVDLAKLPADDPAVYGTLQKADTVGMFQIESRAQMSCLPRLHPTHFYDIVVQVAIIRPGPIVGQMVNPFLMRRQGRQEVVYPHPSLEPVLERTLGVPLFQEQLLRMAMIAAGFSGGEAEELRRAFGFKRSEKRMRDIEVKLREGMKRNGILAEAQEQIIQSITSFALYGFPESHAASFALIAYASAYLKCHYLAAFTAALLNNQPMGFYHPSTIVKDAQRHGLKVKPVDITCSDWACTLEPKENASMWESCEGVALQEPEFRTTLHSLRMGFRYAKGLREDTAQAILRERSKRPFDSIADLAYRVPELRRNEMVLAGFDRRAEFDWPPGRREILSERTSNYCRKAKTATSAPPRCAVAGGARGTLCWSAAREHSEMRRGFSSRADDAGRATGGRLSRHRTHGRSASHGLSPGRSAAGAHSFRKRVGAGSAWPSCADRRMRDCAAKAGHRQRICLSQPGRRDRNQQCDHLSGSCWSKIAF